MGEGQSCENKIILIYWNTIYFIEDTQRGQGCTAALSRFAGALGDAVILSHSCSRSGRPPPRCPAALWPSRFVFDAGGPCSVAVVLGTWLGPLPSPFLLLVVRLLRWAHFLLAVDVAAVPPPSFVVVSGGGSSSGGLHLGSCS